jgi:DNA repair exonuclease SbcCD nuclease subunit
MKVLYVGDVHFKHSHKEECERLAGFIHDEACKNKVDQIVLLGDLNDTFNVLRTDNLTFWSKWLKNLSDHQKLYVLVGNHDKKNQSNDDDKENSLSIFNLIDSPNLFIIQAPVSFGPFAYIPYIHDNARFVKEANFLSEQGAKVLISHTDYDGAQYEGGFYCQNGVKQEELNFDILISGHIHKRSRFGKVIYPGNPRWLTSSDANAEKGIWLVDHDSETGTILNESFLDTSHVCTPIYAYTYKEGDKEAPSIPEGSRCSVELIGSSVWISKEKAKFKGRASVSTRVTDKEKPKNRKTGNSLEHFVTNVFDVSSNVKKDRMLHFMKELGVL